MIRAATSPELDVPALRRRAQDLEGLVPRGAVLTHDDAQGLVDGAAGEHRRLQVLGQGGLLGQQQGQAQRPGDLLDVHPRLAHLRLPERVDLVAVEVQ